jgi:hypothetical protein
MLLDAARIVVALSDDQLWPERSPAAIVQQHACATATSDLSWRIDGRILSLTARSVSSRERLSRVILELRTR